MLPLFRRLTVAGYLALCLGGAASAADPPPVIIISIDTLRADHLSSYGYGRIKTPNVDAFSSHGTIFKAINSQIPLTLPSHTCLFTSTYPFENGVEENAEIVPGGLLTLASVLQQHGYRTGAFIGSDLLSQRYKLDSGFETYDSPFQPKASDLESPYAARVRRDGALVLRAATQWLNAPGGKPAFLFVHLFDLHTPYSVPSPNALIPNTEGYDAELLYVDHILGRFRDMLMAKGWWDRSLVVLLADHGESLGDHGETSHGYFIYQSTLWVPLVIHWPGASQPLPASVGKAAGLIDVAPTILNFLHFEQPRAFHGRSLLQPGGDKPVYSESLYAHDAFKWSILRSLRTDEFQYIDAPSAELYGLRDGSAEQQNVISVHVKEARDLRERLAALLAANAGAHPQAKQDPSPASVNALRSLGYVGSGPRRTVAGQGADPKARLAEYQEFERGLEALYSHHEAQSIAIFRDLLKHDPDNTLARTYLDEAVKRSVR